MLLNQFRLSKGLHHKQPLPGGLHLDFVTLFLRHKAGWRLVRQFQSQLFYEQLGVWRRLCIAGQNQPTLIDRRNPHIDHFDFGQLLQHCCRRQPWGVQQQAMLQCHLQTVSEEGDQYVSVGSMLQLMVDGRMPSSLLRDRKTDSICVNCT